VYRTKEQKDAGILRFVPPQLHAVLLGTFIITRLIFTVGQLGKPCRPHTKLIHTYVHNESISIQTTQLQNTVSAEFNFIKFFKHYEDYCWLIPHLMSIPADNF